DRVFGARTIATLHGRAFAASDGVQRSDRPATRRAPGQLGGAENRAVLRLVHELIQCRTVGTELRCTPDPTRAQHRQAGDVRTKEAAQTAKPEVPRALDEEGAPLVQKGLEVSE